MSVWLWVLFGFGAAAGLFLLALAEPLDVRFDFARGELAESRVRVSWLFGLVSRDVAGGRGKRGKRKHRKGKKDKPKERSLRGLWRSGLGRRGLRLMLEMRRAVRIREFRVRAAVNAGDPSETGMAFALLGPAVGIVSALPRTDIAIVPDFGDAPGVRGEIKGRIRLVPIVALRPLLAFALSPGTWRGLRQRGEAGRS